MSLTVSRMISGVNFVGESKKAPNLKISLRLRHSNNICLAILRRIQSALNSPINSEGNEAVFKEVERCIEQIYQDLMVLTSALSAHLKAVYAQSLLDGKMARSPWWGVFEPQDRFRIGVHSERGDVDAKTKLQMTMRRKPASQLGMR